MNSDDDGNEFRGAFKKQLKDNNIEHFVSIGQDEHHNKQANRAFSSYSQKSNTTIFRYLHTTLETTPLKVLTGKRKHKQKIDTIKTNKFFVAKKLSNFVTVFKSSQPTFS